MTRKVDLIVANPAGNITIMVLTPTEIKDYQEVANKLLEIDFGKEYDLDFTKPQSGSIFGEQVEFLLPYDAKADQLPAMNMCGLEFCGNASRAFAYYRASYCGDGEIQPDGTKKLQVKVSGCDYPLTAYIDEEIFEAKIQMPVPVNVIPFTAQELELSNENPDLGTCFMIDMDGISHLILKNIEATPERFDRIKNYVYNKCGSLEAFGVMFLDKNSENITPVVYVRDVDTTYFEGSCASGTTAAAFGIVYDKPDGQYDFIFSEPAGTLHTIVNKENGKITGIDLYGLLELSEIITVEI